MSTSSSASSDTSSSSPPQAPVDFRPSIEPITNISPATPTKRINHRLVADTVVPKIFYPGEEYALSGIAIRSNLLGFAAASSLFISLYLWIIHSFWQLSFFIGVLAVFHFLEFYITARYNTSKAVIDCKYIFVPSHFSKQIRNTYPLLQVHASLLLFKSLHCVYLLS